MNNQNEIIMNSEVIFVNHSGGKDSQAMLAYIMGIGFKEIGRAHV